MVKEEAKRIIKDTFEDSFNKDQFTKFIKNLLKDGFEIKEFSRSGQYIKTAFQDQVKKFERIGKFTDNNGSIIDVLTVELINANSVERARTSQRNFIRWYLNGSMGDQLKDAALVAFYHPENSDWRFSFIKMQYSLDKKKDEFTPAQRYSYLVGKSEHSHTAQFQFLDLLKTNEIPTLEQLENAFSIEKVTKRFFDEYKELFLILKETIDKSVSKDKIIKAELERKQIDIIALAKKTLGQIVFLYFLQKKGWLGVPTKEPYGKGNKHFLQTLFNECEQKGQNFFDDYLKFLFYDALEMERQDDWQNTNLQIPNTLFHNNTLSADGEEGTGILNVLDRYNFTIKEDEPLEKEVAVDPEMLGKVFESLLSATERKAVGAFYTPREIVHYMCQESLINHIDTKFIDNGLQIPRTDIETFIRKGIFLIENNSAVENQIPESIRNNAEQLDKALAGVLICDPAIGSGAFPVGLMTEIVNARIILYKLQNPQIANDYNKLEKIIYDYKRHCIQHSIYGVDIDNSAIDIAKLRLWLLLVVDEHDYSKIKPLPNLDYKIVCGNSLLSMETNLFNNDKIQLLEKKKEEFFDCSDSNKKHALKEEIEKLFNEITKGKKQFNFKIYFSEVWHYNNGFDIVIGNPPYIFSRNQSFHKAEKKYFYQQFSLAKYQINLYSLFIEKGDGVLQSKGGLSFIVPNNWLTIHTNIELRRFILSQNNIKIINFYRKVFEDASVDSSIILYTKGITKKQIELYEYEETLKIIAKKETEYFLQKKDLIINIESLKNSGIERMIEEIENKSIKLKNIADVKVGLKAYQTGKGKPPQTNEKENRAFHSTVRANEKYYKYLDGRDVQRYFLSWSGEFLKYGEHLAEPRKDFSLFTSERILVRQIPSKPPYCMNACYTKETILNDLNSMNIINVKQSPFYILGILNSRLISFWFIHKLGKMQRGVFPQFKINELGIFPIKIIDRFIVPMEAIVHYILWLKKNEDLLVTPYERAASNYFESVIDGMVYELYFEESVKKHGKDILKYLTDLPEINEADKSQKTLEIIMKVFFELYNNESPVRNTLCYMDSVPEVKIIEGKK